MAWTPTVPPAPARAPVTGWWALLRSLAQQPITLQNLATVKGVMLALQSFSLTNAATVKGLSQATQTMTVQDMATAIGKQLAAQQLTVNDNASWYGVPGAVQPIPILDAAVVVGIVLAPQQISIISEGLITGFEGTLSANQFIPLADSATVAGMQAAGQSFTLVNTSALVGKPGADQVFALTETGAAVGIPAAAIDLAITNAGTVYAVAAANQTLTLANSATAVDATIHGPTFIGYSNGSTGSAISCQVGDMIVGFGFGTTAPTLPAGWTNIANANLTGYGVRFGYKIATATTDPTAVWTGSSGRAMYVFRNCTGMGAIATSAATAAALTMIYPALNLTVLTGTSMLLRIGHRASLGTLSSTSNTPPGYTNASAALPYASYLSGPTANEIAWTTPSFGNSSVYKTITVELLG